MIGYFPEAYPDELFYSICARFSDKMQYPKRYVALQELFGTRGVRAIVDLPSHLETVLKRLPPGHHYTINTIIDYHTLFPFYRPFLKPDGQQRVRECMQNNAGQVIHALLGSTHSTLYSLGCLRFCRSCVEADKKLFGECYWHRVHQLSCVRICPLHRISLLESGVHISKRRYEREFISAEKAVQEKYTPLDVAEAFSQNFQRIAHDVSWLLDHPQFGYDSDLLKTQYYTILAHQGFSRRGKRMYREAFFRSFNDHYPQDFLHMIHCELEIHTTYESWLHRAVRPGGAGTHPLHHLLLIHFLGYEAETFFHLPTTQNSFGDRPALRSTPHRRYSQEECRQQWLLLIEKNPGVGRSVLLKKLPNIYSWLERNDPQWLREHRPPSQRRAPSPRQIDWEKRDKEVAEEIKASVYRLQNTNGYPIKLTLTALGREAGYLKMLTMHLDRLPLTKQIVFHVVETPEDFAIRRIWWLARRYQEEHLCPTRSQLVWRVHISKEIAALPRVKEAIDMAWASLSQDER